MLFALAFGLLGIVVSALGISQSHEATGVWWLPVFIQFQTGLCFLTLAAIYGLRTTGSQVEEFLVSPGWSILLRVVLLPYLILGGVTLYISAWFDGEGLLNAVAPGLYIGRLPFPSEVAKLRCAGIDSVLNLCWEFPRLSGMAREPEVETVQVPVLDASAPSEEQFQHAVQSVVRWRAEGRTVLIHCAQGHGRTATITAAILIQLGLAESVDEALAMIKAVRPFATPSGEQKAALICYAERLRNG